MIRPVWTGVAAAVILCADCAAPASARRCPRYKSRRKAVSAAGAKESARLLPARRWNPAVRVELERLVLALGSSATGYTESRPPTAVIAIEDVAMAHHPGEAAFRRLVTRAEFRFSDAFWDLVPPPHGRRARTGYEGFREQPSAVWSTDPYYRMYHKAMFTAYREIQERRGPRVGYGWLTLLLAGFEDTTDPGRGISDYMSATVALALRDPLDAEEVYESAEDDLPVHMRTGLRLIPEFEDLIRVLLDRGFDVWMFSAANQWAAQSAAAYYGVDPTRVVGIRPRGRNNVVLAELTDPLPVGAGLAEAMTIHLGRAPELVIGTREHKELLEYGGGEGLRIVIDRGDPAFRSYAKGMDWLVQSSFVP